MTQIPKEHGQPSADGIDGRLVLLVTVGVVVVMSLGVVLAFQIERSGSRGGGLQPLPARFGVPPVEINATEMFLLESAGPDANPPIVYPGLAKPAEGQHEVDPANAPQREEVAGAAADAPSRERAERRLGSYGWSSRDQRTVFIPIDRAMELYLERAGERAPREERQPVRGAPDEAPPEDRQPTRGLDPSPRGPR